MSQLGDMLSELRKDQGLTQCDLSEILHISNSSISAYETGSRTPNIEILIALSRYFNVSVDYLLGLSPVNLSSTVLSDEVIPGKTIGSIIQEIRLLSVEQKSAVIQVLEDMRFCREVGRKA